MSKHPVGPCPTCGRAVRGMVEPMTPAQRETLLFLQAFIEANHFAPSNQEIADSLGLRAKSSAYQRILELERKGYIHRNPRRRRSVVILLPEDQ